MTVVFCGDKLMLSTALQNCDALPKPMLLLIPLCPGVGPRVREKNTYIYLYTHALYIYTCTHTPIDG